MQIRNIESSFVWIHRILDLCIPGIVLFAISSLYELDWTTHYQHLAIISGLLVILMNQFVGLYHSWRGRSFFVGSGILLKSWLYAWALLIIIAFMLKVSNNYSRVVLTGWFLLTPFILISYRFIIRLLLAKLYKTGVFVKKAAIYGSGDTSKVLIKTLNSNTWLGYQIYGIYNHADENNDYNQLIDDAKSELYDILYITLPLAHEDEIKDILNALADTTITVKYVPDIYSFDLLHGGMTNIGPLPVFNIYDTPLNDPGKVLLKRIEDIILSSLILLLISPLMVILAIGVKISSPGPIFYKQTRVGWNGKNFSMLKFRSMPVDTEKNGVQWGGSKDKTTNKFGAFIRKTSMDELPQFLNVLKGDMSIVGPRPERDIFVEQFRKEIPRYMQKHLVKAGITGWAQINGWRGDTDLSKRVEFDLFYIDNWSLWLDIKIIFLTIFKGVVNKNAY